MKKGAIISCCVSAWLLVSSVTTQSAILALYNNDDLSLSATSANADIVTSALTASAITLGAGLAGPVSWPDALSVFANALTGSIGDSITAQDYFTFTISTVGDAIVQFENLMLRMAMNTGNIAVDNTVQFYLFSDSTGGFTAGNDIGSFALTRPAGASAVVTSNHTFDLSSFSTFQTYNNDTTEFRIYAVQASGLGNRLGIGVPFGDDGAADMQLNGVVIPEPGTMNLFAMTIVGVLAFRQLRSKTVQKANRSNA